MFLVEFGPRLDHMFLRVVHVITTSLPQFVHYHHNSQRHTLLWPITSVRYVCAYLVHAHVYHMTINIGETNIWRFAIKLQLAKI